MDLNEAAVFVKVVQQGSFSAAARQLGLPTSTVSTRVARLEKRLGVTLLQRTTRRLSLTDAGRVYFEHAAVGLGHMVDAELAVAETSGEPQGRLRVTAPPDIGDLLLAEIVNEIRERYPRIAIEMVLLDHYVDLIADGIDVAIRAGALDDSTLVARSVGAVRWGLFASPGYLLGVGAIDAPQDLRHHQCLQFLPLGRDAWTLVGKQGSVMVPLPGNVLVNHVGVVRSMTLAGHGVALLPLHLCQSACRDQGLVRVLPDWSAREDPFQLVYPRQRFMPPKLRVFIDVAASVLKNWLEPQLSG
jgi:DNA-binding transcriptional LysR family regulator